MPTAAIVDGVDNAIEDGLLDMVRDPRVVLTTPVQPEPYAKDSDIQRSPNILRPSAPSKHALFSLLRTRDPMGKNFDVFRCLFDFFQFVPICPMFLTFQ